MTETQMETEQFMSEIKHLHVKRNLNYTEVFKWQYALSHYVTCLLRSYIQYSITDK